MKWTEVGQNITFPEFGIGKFPKSGSNRLAVAYHPGLSLRGKDRTQNRCPNEEMNKDKKINVHIGTLDWLKKIRALRAVFLTFSGSYKKCYFIRM